MSRGGAGLTPAVRQERVRAPRDRSQFLRTQDPLDARRWPELVWPNLFRLLRRNSGSTGVEGKPGSAHRRAGR